MFTTNIHATEFRARKYQGGFTTVDMLDGTASKAAVFLETREKCDELIAAVNDAKSMLPSEPVPESAEDDAGRAIAADVSQQTARIWAVFEPTQGEVAGPFTRRDAAKWADVNGPSFGGPLTVGPATLDLLDAEDDRLAAAADEAMDMLGGNDERPAPLPPFHASGTGHPSCGAEDSDGYVCTAQRGHAGPVHVAFNPEPGGGIYHTWTDAE